MAASKKVAGFRAWLNIPFHYFKVSLVVWKLKGSKNPHLWGHPDISTLDLISGYFVAAKLHIPGISRAEELAVWLAECSWAACSQLHSWCQWCWAGMRQFAHLLSWGGHTWVDCHTLILCFLFFEASAMLVYSTWGYSGHTAKMQVRIFKSPQSKTLLGYLTWSNGLGINLFLLSLGYRKGLQWAQFHM